MNSQDKEKVVVQEFDLLAEKYSEVHRKNISISGEEPDFFSEYKIRDIAKFAHPIDRTSYQVLDFGCGIGNSIPFFRKYYPDAEVAYSDVSSKSIEVAKQRFPGEEAFYLISEGVIPVEDASQDLVFSACVFHHISHNLHLNCLQELRRITKEGGVLAIYEHNPYNPLTVHAVNTCPLDVNAKLIKPRALVESVAKAGWTDVKIEFKLFFPGFFSGFRPLEKYLEWLPIGAQYRLTAKK